LADALRFLNELTVLAIRGARPTSGTAFVVKSFLSGDTLAREREGFVAARGPDPGSTAVHFIALCILYDGAPHPISNPYARMLDKMRVRIARRSRGRLLKRLMKPFSVLFWSLVVVTVLVSYRWGSMAGLIFFVAALMTGALVASHWTA
jgi:hypothetical protein